MRWKERDTERLIALKEKGLTYAEIGKVLGRTEKSVEHKADSLGLVEREAAIDDAVARRERRRNLEEERKVLLDVASERSFRNTLKAAIEGAVPLFMPPPPYKPTKTKKGSKETVIQMLSDWHGGETVKAEAVRGLNHYDSNVLAERAHKIIDAHISIKRKMADGGWDLPALHIAGLADFVSGTIHELERHSDQANIIASVHYVASVLADCVRRLSAEYKTTVFHGVSGNHGRLPDARRVQGKDPSRNWDTMIYLMVQESLKNCNISFQIPNSYTHVFEAEGYNFLMAHGHDIKSNSNLPHYGIQRFMTSINSLEAGRNRQIHYYLFAHFHSASSLSHPAGEMFLNGSLIGGTEFTVNMLGKADKPSQTMLFVHKEHGVTSRWNLGV